MSRARVAGALVVGALVIGALLIGSHWPAIGSSRTQPDRPAAGPVSASAADSLHVRPAAVSPTEAASPSASAGGSTVSRVGRRYREHDLHLLGDVARVHGSAPPVAELLALRDRGASRDALERHIAGELEGVLVEVAARRWLARELGEPSARAQVGRGGGRSSIGALVRR